MAQAPGVTTDYVGVVQMQDTRIPRPVEAPRSWVSVAVFVAVLVGLVGASREAASAPDVAAGPAPVRIAAVDLVAPQPIEIAFASPVAAKSVALPVAVAPAVAKPAPRRVARVRVAAAPVRRTAAVPVSADCSGAGWQQRRGEKALSSLLHGQPAGVTIAFLPGRGDLKGLTYYDRRHVDVFVGSCADESDRLLRHVVAHELGHAWDATFMTADLRAEYLAARGIPASTPWFGCSGCRDFATPAGDFAETYAQWQRGAATSRTEIARPATSGELAGLAARFFR